MLNFLSRAERKLSHDSSSRLEQQQQISNEINRGSRRSLEQKRKSVEEKLNAVFEKQFTEKQNMLKKQMSHDPTRVNTSPLKSSCSMGDIKTAGRRPSAEEDDKCQSEGSSRNDSLENFSDESDGNKVVVQTPVKSKLHDTVDRAKDKSSAVNVSVITSTPLKKDVSSSGSGDIVVITGKLKKYLNRKNPLSNISLLFQERLSLIARIPQRRYALQLRVQIRRIV